MDINLVEALTYLLVFTIFPILILLLVALIFYIKGKKKFNQEMKEKEKEWNEYEDIDF